jgi:hypothetical protein
MLRSTESEVAHVRTGKILCLKYHECSRPLSKVYVLVHSSNPVSPDQKPDTKYSHITSNNSGIMSSTNGTAHSWTSLPRAMSKAVSSLQKTLDNDAQWQAFIDTKAIVEPVTMGVQSVGSEETILVNVTSGSKTTTSTGPGSKADFVLCAQPQQWEKFFAADPKAPYTSFVGLQVTSSTPPYHMTPFLLTDQNAFFKLS